MKPSNPFNPSFGRPPTASGIRTAIILALGGQAVFLALLLMQGCKPSAQAPAPVATETNAPTIETNANEVALQTAPSNIPLSNVFATNLPELAPTNMVAATNAAPVLETNLAPVNKSTYTVARGDSFYKIALANHVSIRALQAANPGVAPHKLKVGQTLNLPGAGESAVAPATAATAAATATVAVPSAATADGVYVVKGGDTLTRIAHAQHTTVKELRALNNLTTDRIVVGQKLKLAESAKQS